EKEEAERKEKEEAERKEKEEAEKKEREEAERKKEEANRKVKEKVEREAKEAAERKKREDAERKEKEEADRKEKEEAERKKKEEADREEKEEAERKKQEAKRKEEEADRSAKEEAERKARQEAEWKEKEAERKASEAAEGRERQDEREDREDADLKVKEARREEEDAGLSRTAGKQTSQQLTTKRGDKEDHQRRVDEDLGAADGLADWGEKNPGELEQGRGHVEGAAHGGNASEGLEEQSRGAEARSYSTAAATADVQSGTATTPTVPPTKSAIQRLREEAQVTLNEAVTIAQSLWVTFGEPTKMEIALAAGVGSPLLEIYMASTVLLLCIGWAFLKKRSLPLPKADDAALWRFRASRLSREDNDTSSLADGIPTAASSGALSGSKGGITEEQLTQLLQQVQYLAQMANYTTQNLQSFMEECQTKFNGLICDVAVLKQDLDEVDCELLSSSQQVIEHLTSRSLSNLTLEERSSLTDPNDAQGTSPESTKDKSGEKAKKEKAARPELGSTGRIPWGKEWARAGDVLEDDPLYRLQNNDYYYNSYGKLEIHEEMLGDEVRTGTYRRAILDNAPLFEGKTVLDIGSGTGILSLFAAQAGAKHVYGIECSEIVDVARTIAAANGLGDRITYIRGKVEDIELPVDEVDIIVSEWMGYCLLYEAMLDSVLYARDKWLASDGYMLPDRAYLYVAGINGWEDLDDRKHFWDSVGGVRMSCVKEELSTEPVVTGVDADTVCTATACALELDLYSCTSSDLQFVTHLRLPSTRRDLGTGLVIWFDVAFTFGNDPIAMVYTMTTGPDSTPTHWQQTVLYFDHFCPLAHSEYMSKDTLECTLGIRKSQWNPRNLDIKIVYRTQTTPDPLGGLAATDTTSAVHTKMYRMS
ncbi:Protein arginine N-methyltransferase 1, partial [Perkinsus olseni]